MSKLFLSIVAPAYNEADAIIAFLEQTQDMVETLQKPYEILIVDDGSSDATVDIIKQYMETHAHIRLIVFSRNYGHEIAITAGLEHARGDYVLQMDSDLQHPPEYIPLLLNKIQEGYDVVYAARENRDEETWLKRTCAKFFYAIARRMTGFSIPDNATNFRVMTQQVVRSFRKLKESNRHILMLFAYIGFKTASIPFKTQERVAGSSKYSYRKLIDLALDSIISFSHRPLRYMSALSVCVSVIMAFYAGFILLQRLFYHPTLADGMASIIFITSGLFAILFLFLAVISEYIGRILVESKNRPLYYISEDTYHSQMNTKNHD